MNSAEFLDSSWKTGLRLGLFSAKTGTPNSATCAPEAIPAGHMAELKCLQPDTGQDFDAFTHMKKPAMLLWNVTILYSCLFHHFLPNACDNQRTGYNLSFPMINPGKAQKTVFFLLPLSAYHGIFSL